jgi:hypothetical protein
MVENGLHWAVTGRTIEIGDPAADPIATLYDAAWADPPSSTDDGLTQGNDWLVTGNGSGDAQLLGRANDQASITKYGLLERNDSDPNASTQAGVDASAQQRVASYTAPIVTVDGGTLRQDAPVLLSDLKAGARVTQLQAQQCRSHPSLRRVTKVGVTADKDSEKVVIESGAV